MAGYFQVVFTLLLCAVSIGSTAVAQPTPTGPVAGVPITAARRQAINARPFDRRLDAARVLQWVDIASSCTIAEFELFLAPLSPSETQFLKKIRDIKPPIINRLHFEDLRDVLRNGGLLSLDDDKPSPGATIRHTTPAIENELLGAFDCVFASVGPPNGTPRYGDVIIRLKDSVRENGWATPFSGMYFIRDIRGKDAEKMQSMLSVGKSLPTAPTDPLSLGFDDRLHYSHYVVAEKHWNKALAYQAILVRRNADDSLSGKRIRDRFEQLIVENDTDAFWKLFIPAMEPGLSKLEEAARVPFGYLEAKFTNQLSIDDFTSIEVPVEKLQQVQAWAEAKPYAHLIRAKPQDAF